MRTIKKPRISISEVIGDNIETVLDDIRYSKSVMAFLRTKNGDTKFLHTGLGEKDYATMLLMLCRHLGFFTFVKLAVRHAELYNKQEGLDGFKFTGKALEYLEWKRNNFNQIRTTNIL